MLLAIGTAGKLEVVTSSVADLDVHASAMDYDGTSAVVPYTESKNIVTAVTTKILTEPAASHSRNVKFLSFRNKHASTANTIIVRHFDGTTTTELIKVTLLAGEELTFSEGAGWQHFDANGNLYASAVPSASDTSPGTAQIAVQADQEAATDALKIVTPARQKFHPSAPKFWIKSIVTTNVPALTVSYNVTSITDNATGFMTVTFTVAFSSANWCCQVSNERTTTSLTVANLRYVAVRNALQAAGSVVLDGWDGTATTALAADPQAWHATGLGDQ